MMKRRLQFSLRNLLLGVAMVALLVQATVTLAEHLRFRRLVKALQSSNAGARRSAALELGEMGPKGEAAVPALVRAMRAHPSDDAEVMAEALAGIGPASVPELVFLLRPRNEIGRNPLDVREYSDEERYLDPAARRGLALLGPQAEGAVDALIALLEHEDSCSYYVARHIGASCAMPALEAEGCAADVLSGIGPKAVPPLTVALRHPNEHVRAGAFYALGRMGPDAKAAVPQIVAALKTEPKKENVPWSKLPQIVAELQIEPKEEYVPWSNRELATWSLGNIGPDAKPAVPYLVAAVKSGTIDDEIAAAAIKRIDPSDETMVVLLAERFVNSVGDAQVGTSSALAELGSVAIPALTAAAADDDPGVRDWAVFQLSRMALRDDPNAPIAVPVLIERLADSGRWEGPSHAAIALGEIGPPAKQAVPALVGTIKTREPMIQVHAALALMKVDPGNRFAMETLIGALHGTDKSASHYAVRLLAELGPAAEPAIPALIEALNDDDADMRRRAADALGAIGPAAAVAIPALTDAIGDDYGGDVIYLGSGAEAALAKIGPEAVPALAAALRHGDAGVRWEVLVALGEMGPQAKDAVPVLIELLDSEEGPDRWYAAEVLGKLGPSARQAVPALREALRDEEPQVRENAREALEKIGG
jgi:HEAT repeat protein